MSEILIDGRTVTEELQRLSEYGNRDFSVSLHPGIPHILGVRIPDLRKLAKKIVQMNWQDYLADSNSYYMEERILYGLVLGSIRPDGDIETYLKRVTHFVHLINSWSVCDTFTFAGGKVFVKEHSERIWEYLKSCMNQTAVYEIRFGVVMAIKYFVDEQHIEEMLVCLDGISNDDYYVKMAVAWALSECYVKYPVHTLHYLHENRLDDFTYNKSLQKIVESNRVALSDKQMIKSMRRNNR